ncbi:MAG TPA: hypothetical protein VI318_08205 [Baekduia sp.]
MSRCAALLLTGLLALSLGAASAPAKAKHKPKPKHKPTIKVAKPSTAGTPATGTLLAGSAMTFDLGNGQPPRTIRLTGTAKGIIPGGYRLNRDNTIKLQSAAVQLDPGDAAAAGIPPVGLRLDPRMGNRIEIARTGALTAALGITSSGIALPTFIVRPTGKLAPPSGLASTTLDSPPQWVTFGPLGAAVSTHLVINIKIG